MLHEFLLEYEEEILVMTERKSLILAGVRPSSDLLKRGLPIFYKQLLEVLEIQLSEKVKVEPPQDHAGAQDAAKENDEPAMTIATGRPEEKGLAKSAGIHGLELLRLGYTLSHVVHAYGSMCQSITELAMKKNIEITADEFHDLNRCLDVAIAGAVTEYQTLRNSQESNREVEHLGSLAHELRNALGTVKMSIELIREGTVGFNGSTGQVLDRGLKRIEDLIDRSLMEVRLRVDPVIYAVPVYVLEIVDQIVLTAGIEARAREQILEVKIDPLLVVQVDQQLIYSALSNLIQNAIKYTPKGGKIQVRAATIGDTVKIEVEDECGGLSNTAVNLFKPFEQQNENRKGLGLGLTIAQRAIVLNKGTISVKNLPKQGCIFEIILPTK